MKPVFFGSARTWIITAFVISALTGVATWSLKEGTAATGKNPEKQNHVGCSVEKIEDNQN